ncbi:replication protein [Chloroflexota bacterium]
MSNEKSNDNTMYYEDGTRTGTYSAIPHAVLDKIADIDFTKDEWKILLRIIRNTIGYEAHKNLTDGLSVRRMSYDFTEDYLVEKTGVGIYNLHSALDSLTKRNIIKCEKLKITFNNNLGEWI